jgi:DNA polymerase epsilon subunit 3
VIVRLAKSVLPENTMIQKEAVTALVKSATVFINYLAATYFCVLGTEWLTLV